MCLELPFGITAGSEWLGVGDGEQGSTRGQYDLDFWFLGDKLLLSCSLYHTAILGWNSRCAFCNNLQSRPAKPGSDGGLGSGQP